VACCGCVHRPALVFICMLACYVRFELARRLAPLLYTDHTPLSAADPVAPASRSPQAAAKAASGRAADDQVAHSLEDLLSDLGTLCRNELRIGADEHTFPRLTTATELQATRSNCSASRRSRQTRTSPESRKPRGSGLNRVPPPKTSG
jgi:hypothetical protein